MIFPLIPIPFGRIQLYQKPIRMQFGERKLTQLCRQETIADFLVRGRIIWDDEQDGRVPLLVIDVREISWEQFGRMLMSFEGWQFKLEIRDRSEEI
jgi:hypothetical protein